MNALVVIIATTIIFIIAYFTYARFIERRILKVDSTRIVPSHEFNDGVDYVPTNRFILFGHHFSSVAGLMPITGPAVAVIWGWLPALLWVLLGSIFLGGIHDIGSMIVSTRHGARSMGDISVHLIGRRGRLLFLLISLFLLGLSMGIFVYLITSLFMPETGYPKAVFPTGALILIAIAAGIAIYRFKYSVLYVSIVAIILMFIALFIGMWLPITGINRAQWQLILLGYAFAASVLPVWLLLQPRDFINSFQLYVGMLLLIVGLFIARPQIVAPAFNTSAPDLAPVFPLLFVTVACGAISGFHSLVSSGTTAKQLASEGDARFIGYGAMLLEGLLAAVAILICTAGVASSPAEWLERYPSWQEVSKIPLNIFVDGSANILNSLGIEIAFGKIFIAVVIVSFAMTSLDTATRLLRYNIEEIGESIGFKPLSNRYLSSLSAVVIIGVFAFAKVGDQAAGIYLMQLFGTTNQLLAALALLVISIYLSRQQSPTLYTIIPMIIMLAVTLAAMVINLRIYHEKGAWLLFGTGGIILALTLWLLVEAWLACRQCKLPLAMNDQRK